MSRFGAARCCDLNWEMDDNRPRLDALSLDLFKVRSIPEWTTRSMTRRATDR